MSADESLFDTEAMIRELAVGQPVNVRLSWGDERGVVTGFEMVGGFPMVQVAFTVTGLGTASVGVASVAPEVSDAA